MFAQSRSASYASSEVTSISTGSPVEISLPFMVIYSTVGFGYMHPIFILTSSAVLSPITTFLFFFMYFTIDSSNLSPAILSDVLLTDPPSEITAISAVPPPISTIILP